MKTFVTLIRREFWENRGGFLWAPFVVVALFMLFTLIGLSFGEMHVEGSDFRVMNFPLAKMGSSIPPEVLVKLGTGLNVALAIMAMAVQLVLGVVLFFYLIGALFDDRKDRSILFWKSMPVSDIQTVGSKVFTAAFVAPGIAWVAGIVFHLLMFALVSLFMAFHGVNMFKIMSTPGIAEQVNPLEMWLSMLVAIPVNALWALPAYGWLLLVSSWARSKPFIWAVVVPIVSGALLSLVDTLAKLRIPESWMWFHIIPRGLGSVFPFSWTSDKSVGYTFNEKHLPSDMYTLASLGDVLSSANLWIGVAAGAAMIAGAVYMRRYREIAD